MYINKSKLRGSKIITILLDIFFGGWGFLWLVCTIAALSGDEDLAEDWAIYLGFFIKDVVILYFSIRQSRFCNKVREYATCFEGDHDGVVSISEFASLKHIEEQKILVQLQKMISKRYLINVHLDFNNVPKLVLDNEKYNEIRKVNQEREKISVCCPHCGAMVNVLPGKQAMCEYCRSMVKAEVVRNK